MNLKEQMARKASSRITSGTLAEINSAPIHPAQINQDRYEGYLLGFQAALAMVSDVQYEHTIQGLNLADEVRRLADQEVIDT